MFWDLSLNQGKNANHELILYNFLVVFLVVKCFITNYLLFSFTHFYKYIKWFTLLNSSWSKTIIDNFETLIKNIEDNIVFLASRKNAQICSVEIIQIKTIVFKNENMSIWFIIDQTNFWWLTMFIKHTPLSSEGQMKLHLKSLY